MQTLAGVCILPTQAWACGRVSALYGAAEPRTSLARGHTLIRAMDRGNAASALNDLMPSSCLGPPKIPQARLPRNHRELFDLATLRLVDLNDDLEHGDSSDAPMMALVASEGHVRIYIGNWLRKLARGR